MLARLRHRAVDRADHQDRAVHLRRAGDHVLDVVGVARAVHVRVVPVRRRVLDVARRDRQDLRRVATALRLGRLRHLVVRDELRPALVGRHLRQRRRQRRLAVVDVPDGAHVDVRFGTIEFLFCHVVVRPRVTCRARYRDPCPPSLASRSGETAFAASACSACLAELARESRAKAGADDQDRTGDLVLTKDALCQLSYIGLRAASLARRRYGRQVGLRSTADRPAATSFAHRSVAHRSRRPASRSWLASRSSPRSRERRLERETGIEPATNSLEGCDSTTELLPPSRSLPLALAALRGSLPIRRLRPRSLAQHSLACQP